jgi:hypothetical protein
MCLYAGTHLLDEPIDEVLLQRAEIASGLGDHAVEHRAGEDGVQLHEVLFAVGALGGGAHGQEAAGLARGKVAPSSVRR